VIIFLTQLTGLIPGEVLHEKVADMIKQGCRKTVVILSPDYIKSPWCKYEANLAMTESPGEKGVALGVAFLPSHK
jgi:hypothetical protein